MNNIVQAKMKKFTEYDKEFALFALVALVCFVMYFGNTVLQMRASNAALNTINQEHVARGVFSSIDLVSKNAAKEIECVGSEKLEIACNISGNELHIIKFRTKSSMPDFSIHAVRNVVDSKVQIEIRNVSYFPKPDSVIEVEKLAEIFRNPSSVE